MKKIVTLILALALVFGCVATLCSCGNKDALIVCDGKIYVGIYEPATGSNGAGGKQETLGIYYANSVKPTVTIGNKQYDVVLVEVDNQSSNDKAVSAATELINKNVCVALGSYGSGVSIAAESTFAAANLAAIGVSCTNPQVTEGNDNYFRICFLDPFQGTVLANYAKDQQKTKAYVLARAGEDYGVGLANYFKLAFGAETVDYVYDTFPENTSDFTTYVQNAQNAQCDVIFAPTSTDSAQLIIDACHSKGFDGLILAGDTWDSNVITEAATGKDLDIEVTTFYQEGADVTFDTGFKQWLNADAARLAKNGGNDMIAAPTVMGYDAYMTALAALENLANNLGMANADEAKRSDVSRALATMNTEQEAYTGVTGKIYFNATGDANRNSAVIKKVNTQNGTWDFVKTQTADK